MAAIAGDAAVIPARRFLSTRSRLLPIAAVLALVIGLLAWNIQLQGGATDPGDSFAVALSGSGGAEGRLHYIESEEIGILIVTGLRPLPPGQTYRVWAFTKDGLQARLFLVGSGEYQSELEGAARALGITENVSFLGWRDDVLEVIAAAQVKGA